MTPDTRALLEKMVQAMKAKLMALPTPKKGAAGPNVNVTININEQQAKSPASGGSGQHSGIRTKQAIGRVNKPQERDDQSYFGQQAISGGYQTKLNPIAAYFERKKYAAFSQFGEIGSKLQHYLGVLGDKEGSLGAFGRNVSRSLSAAGGTVNFFANDAAPIAAAVTSFLSTAAGKQVLTDAFQGIASMAQVARNAITEPLAAVQGGLEAKKLMEARLRFGGAKADLSDIPKGAYEVARDEARDKSRAEGLVQAKAAEETAKGIGTQPGQYSYTLAQLVTVELRNQFKRFMDNEIMKVIQRFMSSRKF